MQRRPHPQQDYSYEVLNFRPSPLTAGLCDAPGQGAVVWNMVSRAREASKEIMRVFSEILPEAKMKRNKNKRAARIA